MRSEEDAVISMIHGWVACSSIPAKPHAPGSSLAAAWLRIAMAGGPIVIGLIVATGGLGSVFLIFSLVAAVTG